MGFKRDKFGIEYNSNPINDDESSGLGWVIVIAALVALVSLTVTLISRIHSSEEEPADEVEVVTEAPAPVVTESVAEPVPEEIPAEIKRSIKVSERPHKVQNLLKRMEEARKRGDIRMEASAIEQLRGYPGEAVADLDDALARRLGFLNIRQLFVNRDTRWVSTVTVRSGDNASRIAFENGTTLAALLRLNGLPDANKVQVGQTLRIMKHPSFRLVVHRSGLFADLTLNDRFFKRYDLIAPVRAEEGRYTTGGKFRDFMVERGISFRPTDRSELEMLLPPNVPVLISER